MKSIFKILTGNAKDVENSLNKYQEKHGGVCIMGMSATNESTTVIIQIT